jgi:hypothetical protein
MCNTHKHLGSAAGNEIVVPAATTATLEQRSEKADPRIEDRSQRALPDRSAQTRSDIGMDSINVPSINQTTVEFAVARANDMKPTVQSAPKVEPRSDRGSGSDRKKDDPRGNDQKPSKPKPTRSEPIAQMANEDPPKPAPETPKITADSHAQKPVAPYVPPAAPVSAPTKPAAKVEPPKPAAVEKKEIGEPELKQIRSAMENGWNRFTAIPSRQTDNRKRVRNNILDTVFSVAGENPRGDSARFVAAKRLAKQAGGDDFVKMIDALHRN